MDFLFQVVMHEMVHAWQTQKGMFVRTRGLFFRFADYSYSPDKTNFFHYSLEQQASIASDYWLLLNSGLLRPNDLHKYRNFNPKKSTHSLLARYKAAMKGFPG
ncbi:hypothetical protein TUM12370_11850 [Salmonella enterica subsp. enterica serovar Choleraesuis]|nr:hypothetical protein TUM12370_11850 [Salmonella enterica subsp. enterica serovar Choleraesuis]